MLIVYSILYVVYSVHVCSVECSGLHVCLYMYVQ